VSYGIVREHGGEIEVESVAGKGTQFLLTFPLYDPSVARPAAVREALRPALETSVLGVTAMSRTEIATGVPARISAQSDRIVH
jgi:hypothetical protein